MRAAAVEGRLETRGDAAKFEGGYRDIIQGFNDTLEAVVTPMNVAAEYIDQISRGILPEPITEDYKGNFAAIKNNLNKCIAALDAMRQDGRTMCIAALEGRLDARVDATKHEGVYMKIVQGLDDVIDAVVNPINESAAVLWRAADGQTPLAEIVTRDICPAFDIDADTALRDATELAHGLAERGILQVAPQPFDQGNSPT